MKYPLFEPHLKRIKFKEEYDLQSKKEWERRGEEIKKTESQREKITRISEIIIQKLTHLKLTNKREFSTKRGKKENENCTEIDFEMFSYNILLNNITYA